MLVVAHAGLDPMYNTASWGPDFEGAFETETETHESVLRAEISKCLLALLVAAASSQLSHLHWHDVSVV